VTVRDKDINGCVLQSLCFRHSLSIHIERVEALCKTCNEMDGYNAPDRLGELTAKSGY